MESALFSVPKMYADHHVLTVRDVLLQTPGVEEVKASAMLKKVAVSFDPATTSSEAIEKALSQAGYGPNDRIEISPLTPGKDDGSFWHTWRPRDTKTNLLDLEASGDHRKY